MLEELEERAAVTEEVAEEEEAVEELKIEELKVLLNVIKTWRKVLTGEAPPATLEEISFQKRPMRGKGAEKKGGKKAKKAKSKKASSSGKAEKKSKKEAKGK